MARVDVDAWGEGYEACGRGIANPYNSGTVKAIEWDCGFQACEAKAAERGETTNGAETMGEDKCAVCDGEIKTLNEDGTGGYVHATPPLRNHHAAKADPTTNGVETMSKTTTDTTHPVEMVAIAKERLNELVFNAAQCARLRKDVATLTERLDDEGIEAPPGPDLVTLHATWAMKLCGMRLDSTNAKGKDRRPSTWEEIAEVAANRVKESLAFAESERAGDHVGDVNKMVESELSADETLRRMQGGVARGGETGGA